MRTLLNTILLLAIAILPIDAQKIKVACIGNSITYGTTLENRETESYPSVLQTKLGDGYIVGNFGKPGATLLFKGHRPYIKQEEFSKALEFNGDIAIIHLGVNDTDPRDWPNYGDDFANDYLTLIDTLRKQNPEIRIIIAKITPIRDTHPRFNSGTKQWHKQIQNAIELVSKISNTELIDFYHPMDMHPEFYNDICHPDKRGAQILADIAYKAITGNYGGLKLPITYTDNMVLQKDKEIIVSGTANSGTRITVRFNKLSQNVITNNQGKWEIRFPAIHKPMKNLTMQISSDKGEKIVLNNICIGEVWLCSGQSNMAFKLHQASSYKDDFGTIQDENIRLFNMQPNWNTDNVEWSNGACDSINTYDHYQKSKWELCETKQASEFSAIAYYFGKILSDSLKMPIGLICNAVGGSTQESWIDRITLEDNMPLILRDWLNNDYIQDWCRGRARKNMANTEKGEWTHHPYEPCYLYNAGILPLCKYPIKGVIWYQGESNAHCSETYAELFKLFVKSWRNYWNDDNLPIYYAQLSSLNRPSWCYFRDTQRVLASEVPNTGMVVTSDKGNTTDVHPKQKKEIGARFGYWALNKQYGFKLVPSGPMIKKTYCNSKHQVVLEFDYADDGLTTSDLKHPSTFEVAEYDGRFIPATSAVISGNKIIIESDKIRTVNYVRYGWQPYTTGNLINKNGLPASTFKIKTSLKNN